MSWWDSVTDFFSGGSSNTTSSSYEEAAYGGSKNDYYESLDSSFDDNDDDSGSISYNPNVGAPTSDAPAALSDSYFLKDSSGNIVEDEAGNPILTPESFENFAEQQEAGDELRILEAEALKREAERRRKIAEEGINFFDPLTQGGNLPLDLTPQEYYGMFKTPQAGITSSVVENFFNVGGLDTGEEGFQDYVNFRTQGNEVEDIDVFEGNIAYKDNFSAAGAATKFGQGLMNQGGAFFKGLFAGYGTKALTGSNAKALEAALGTNQAANFLQPFKADVFVDADGNQYVRSTYNGKTSKYSMAEMEENAAKAREDAAKWAENSSSDDIASSMQNGMALASGNRGGSWKDGYKAGNLVDLEGIAHQVVRGTANASDIKAIDFGTRVALGDDVVTAAFDVYGDTVRELLPEGYERPTEAAVRIGLGENRVAVLGDIYGEDFNLDTPVGKAGLKAAEVYDITGDGDEALKKGVFTFFKEGGAKEWALSDYKLPNFIPEGVNLDVGNWDWWKSSGFSIKDLNLFKDFSLRDINFGGLKLDEIEGLNFDNLGDFGLEVKDLPDMGIDIDVELEGIKDLGLSLNKSREAERRATVEETKGKVLAAREEEFVPLESEFDLPQTQDLATFLIKKANQSA